jgi:hypothetical protein
MAEIGMSSRNGKQNFQFWASDSQNYFSGPVLLMLLLLFLSDDG